MKQSRHTPFSEPSIIENAAIRANHAPFARAAMLGAAIVDAVEGSLQRIRPIAIALLGFSRSQHLPVCSHNGPQSSSERWIQPKMPLVLPKLQRQTIHCITGSVWLTQGDGNDYLLKAGEALTLHPVDTVLITAMAGPALIRNTPQHLPQHLLSETELNMDALTLRERELVALGAAMGCNCQPCIEFHIPAARETGLSDAQISEAIRIADRVRRVPALKVLRAALSMLPHEAGAAQVSDKADRCVGMSTMSDARLDCSA